jgi:transposase
MPRTRPPYPREFREEAVRLVRESGKSAYQIARDLGVSEQSLRTWVKQTDLDAGRRADGLTTEEREELRRLRREVRILREERDILKKVLHAAWCGTSDRMKVVVGESGCLTPRWR